MLTSFISEYAESSGDRGSIEPEEFQRLQREEMAIRQEKLEMIEKRLARVEDHSEKKQTTTGGGGGKKLQEQSCCVG